MTLLLLDTNILLAAAEGTPVYDLLQEEYPHLDLATLESAKKELERLRTHREGLQAQQARLALQLLEEQDLYIVHESSTHVDDALLIKAKELGAWIATLDKELQQAARKAEIPVLTLTGKGRIKNIQ